MKKLKKIIFRVDCNKQIGFGHIYRCLNLANLFLKKKVKLIFIIKSFQDQYYPKIPKKIKVYKINEKIKKKNEAEIIKKIFYYENSDLLILDTDYSFNYSEKKNKEFILAIDELSKRIIYWDNLYNPNWEILATYRPYPNFINLGKINKNTKKIYGFDKFYQIENIKKINVKKNIAKIVLSLGGTKNCHNIKYILNSIHDYNKLLKITVLIANKEDFRFLKKNFKKNKNINLIFRIKNVHKVLKNSDLAIVSGGMSKYESLIHCLPSLIFNLNTFQKKINSKIFHRKIAINVDTLKHFDKKFRSITKNYELRKILSMNCKTLRKEYNENTVYKKFKNLI